MSLAHHIIAGIWQRQSLWAQVGWAVLTPFSLAFSLAVRARTALYDVRIAHITHVPLKVISVGNLTVGGTGKTPMTLWLAQTLQQRGFRVGILTRGYKGTASGPTLVGQDGSPLVTPVEVGDEAVLLARRFPGVVIAGSDRVAAAQLAHQRFGLDALILDDGFQHRRLHREVDVVLVSEQGLANTWLLPAGPFREPLTAIHRAHALVLSKRILGNDHSLSSFIGNPQSPIPLFHADLIPTSLVQVVDRRWLEQPLSLLAGKRIMAVTAIANPKPFYQTLQQQGAEIVRVVEFPDHHSYTHSEWQQLNHQSSAVDMLLTTEKDLVKLEHLTPTLDRLLTLRVDLQIEPAEAFLHIITQRLRSHN